MHWCQYWLLAIALLSTQAARAAEPDRIQGNWTGDWTLDGGGGGKQTAQIIAVGNGEYQGAFTAYDGSEMDNETFRFIISGTLVDDKISFATTIPLGEKLGTFEWKAELKDGTLKGRYTNNRNYTGGFMLKRVELKPDGLGAKPLPGAVVLFDGKGLDAWTSPGGGAPTWKIVGDALQVARKNGAKAPQHLVSRMTFEDAQIHLEYRTPYLPEARGQERGNSGVFLQGRYEIQIIDNFGQPRVLDNFGELADDDSTGAVFGQYAPLVNATLPPGEWQTLDILFLAPRLDANGQVERPGEITITHNGQLIQDRVKIRRPTKGAPIQDLAATAGLILEDGGQPVEYRNLWMVKLNPAK